MEQTQLAGQFGKHKGEDAFALFVNSSLSPATASLEPELALEDLVETEDFASSCLIVVPNTSEIQEFLIRALDIAGALFGLIITSPLLLITALLIRVFSPGAAIYRQLRMGKDGKPFIMYKFRTMVNHADKIWGLAPAELDDKRVTRIGKMLRATRLDEIPQLFNVLRGDMSLVGPRPENIYRVSIHRVLRGPRLAVRPGLTGLAQIRGLYDIKPERKIRYDYLYIKNRSLQLNLSIILRTIPVVLFKRGW